MAESEATNLFANFKEQYKQPEKALTVSIEMLAVAEQYAALETSDDPIWAQYSTTAREHVRSLKLLGARQTHPVMLAALKKFEPSEMEKLLRLLETIIVRYQLIGGGRTGKLEIECARLAEAIYSGKISDANGQRKIATAHDVFQECHEVYPSDPVFEDDFASARETNNQKAVYILRGVERELRRKEQQTRAAENEPGSLTLEHICPKNPGEEWSKLMNADPFFKEDCINRLGNMCLQIPGDNRKIARASFDDKKKVYAESTIRLTRNIPTNFPSPDWDRKSVESRQVHMAKLAVTVWRF